MQPDANFRLPPGYFLSNPFQHARIFVEDSGAKFECELIYRGEGINVCSSCESWRIKDVIAGEKLISARQTIGIHLFTEMIDDTRQCLPGVLGCVTKAYLSRSGPNRERHRGRPYTFISSRRDPFIDHFAINRASRRLFPRATYPLPRLPRRGPPPSSIIA